MRNEADVKDTFWTMLTRSYVSLVVGIDVGDLRGASGCIVDYRGSRFLLTVRHASHGHGPATVPMGGGKAIEIRRFHYIRAFSLDGTIDESSEAAIAALDGGFRGIRINLANEPVSDIAAELSTVHPSSKFGRPVEGIAYGVAGETEHELSQVWQEKPELCFTESVHRPFAYARTVGDMHYFRMPVAHPGHQWFKGMSGSPIMDKTGMVVALLAGGSEATDEVWGVTMQSYVDLMDMYLIEHAET